MAQAPIPTPTTPGGQRNARLRDTLTEVLAAQQDLAEALPFVNDPILRAGAERLSASITEFLAPHVPQPGPTLADDLTALLDAVRMLRLPATDGDFGRTEGLRRLRGGTGLVIQALTDALDAAAALSLAPRHVSQPGEPEPRPGEPVQVPRAGLETRIAGLEYQLGIVQGRMDSLRTLAATPTTQVNHITVNHTENLQFSLINEFTSQMRIRVDVVRLALGDASEWLNLSGLTRGVALMADTTGEFVVTLRDWRTRALAQVSDTVVQLAEGVRDRVNRVGLRTRGIVRSVRRRILASTATAAGSNPVPKMAEDTISDPGDALANTAMPPLPPDFSHEAAEALILAGTAPPPNWRPFITQLGFGRFGWDAGGQIVGRHYEFQRDINLNLLANLSNLRRLALTGMAVIDIGPLASLANLERLDLDNTPVADLAPLASLANLQTLYLSDTQAADLVPLASLANLQELYLSDTQAADLTPLASLAKLQDLDLSYTQAADLAPLASLAKLQHLDLSYTQAADLTPLASLAKLQHLDLSYTQAADLAPLASLANLQYLDLSNTQAADLAPLASLANLQHLNLSHTQAADLAPLASLANLQFLDLSSTHAADLSPLASLANLQHLYLSSTQAADLAPLTSLANLQFLDLSSTHAADLSPLAILPALRRLDITGVQADLTSIAREGLYIVTDDERRRHRGSRRPRRDS